MLSEAGRDEECGKENRTRIGRAVPEIMASDRRFVGRNMVARRRSRLYGCLYFSDSCDFLRYGWIISETARAICVRFFASNSSFRPASDGAGRVSLAPETTELDRGGRVYPQVEKLVRGLIFSPVFGDYLRNGWSQMKSTHIVVFVFYSCVERRRSHVRGTCRVGDNRKKPMTIRRISSAPCV